MSCIATPTSVRFVLSVVSPWTNECIQMNTRATWEINNGSATEFHPGTLDNCADTNVPAALDRARSVSTFVFPKKNHATRAGTATE